MLPARRRDPPQCHACGDTASGWVSLSCGVTSPGEGHGGGVGRASSEGGTDARKGTPGTGEKDDDHGGASVDGGSSQDSYFSDGDDVSSFRSLDVGEVGAEGVDESRATGTGIESLQTVGMVRNFTPWVMSERGYDIEVEADFLDSVIATSIPSQTAAGRIWACEAIKVCVSQHGGLKFNDPQSWGYEIIVSESSVTVLRDHIRLIVDLVQDWQWQPPADKARSQTHQFFVPCVFKINLTLHSSFSLTLVTSEDNIVDDYADAAQTSYIVAKGRNLAVESRIKADRYQPPFGETAYTGWFRV